MFMIVSLCVCPCMQCLWRPEDALDLKLWDVLSHLMCLLENEPRSSRIVGNKLTI